MGGGVLGPHSKFRRKTLLEQFSAKNRVGVLGPHKTCTCFTAKMFIENFTTKVLITDVARKKYGFLPLKKVCGFLHVKLLLGF